MPVNGSSNGSKVSTGTNLEPGQQSPRTKQRGGLVGWLFGHERKRGSDSPTENEDPYALPQDAMTLVEKKRRQAMLERQVADNSAASTLSPLSGHHKPVLPPAIVVAGSSPPEPNVRLASRPLPHRPISQYGLSDGTPLPPICPTMAVLSEDSSSDPPSSDDSSNASQFDNLEELYTQVERPPRDQSTKYGEAPGVATTLAKPRFVRQRRHSRRDVARPQPTEPAMPATTAASTYVPAGTHLGTLQRLKIKSSDRLHPQQASARRSTHSQVSAGSSRYGFETPGVTAQEQRSLATVQRLLAAGDNSDNGDKRASAISSSYGFDQQASHRSRHSSAFGFADSTRRHSSGYGFSNLPTPQASVRRPTSDFQAVAFGDMLFNDELLGMPTQHLPSEPTSRHTSHHGHVAPPLPARDRVASSGATSPRGDSSDSWLEGDDEDSEAELVHWSKRTGEGHRRSYQGEAGYETVEDEPPL